MSSGATPRPVIILGAQRSGVSLLAVSLAQHPNLHHIRERDWFAQVRSTGASAETIGAMINGQLLRFDEPEVDFPGVSSPIRPSRWLDDRVDHVKRIPRLVEFFPEARFIHVLRDIGGTVGSFQTEDPDRLYLGRPPRQPADWVTKEWLQAVRRIVDAEMAYGSDVILRVRRSDLVSDPLTVLEHVFAFIGEPFAPAALWPFRTLDRDIVQERPALQVVDKVIEVEPEIEALSAQLLAEGTPWYPRDDSRIERLGRTRVGDAEGP